MYGSTFEVSLWLDQKSRAFAANEDGSSTVEMVVLMAASISLTLAVMSKVSGGIENLSADISGFLSDIEIRTSFDDPEPEQQG